MVVKSCDDDPKGGNIETEVYQILLKGFNFGIREHNTMIEAELLDKEN